MNPTKCPECGLTMKPLFTSFYCPFEPYHASMAESKLKVEAAAEAAKKAAELRAWYHMWGITPPTLDQDNGDVN